MILFIPMTSAEANIWLTNKQLKLPAKQKDVVSKEEPET